jgi:lipid-A-disaccharide synthase
MNRQVMIVAGEASGDLHGARLVQAMQVLDPNLVFSGIGGTELRRAGVEILYDAAKIAVVGFIEVFSHVIDIISAQKIFRNRLVSCRPALLILIDFPDFNFLLARKAKKLGIPVFYYISPQVWAWRSGRVKTIARLVDRIGVILPFEEQYYRERGVNAHYVGHPLLDSVRVQKGRDEFCGQLGISPKRKLVGILPGSRIKEVKRLLPVFLQASHLFQQKCDEIPSFLIPCAPTLTERELRESGIDEWKSKLDLHIVHENRYELMAACDVVIAASGTVTLELLLVDTPMVVAYKFSPWTYQLGKLLVKVDYFSLVNLIAGEEIVPELLQEEANPERISSEMFDLVYNKGIREKQMSGLIRVKKLLGEPGASQRAAQLALTLLH